MRQLAGPLTRSLGAVGLIVVAFVTACAPAPSSNGGQPGASAPPSSPPLAGPKGTLRIAWAAEPVTLSPKMGDPGGTAFNELAVTFNSALTYHDQTGKSFPQIAQEIPTIENGGWVVNADGSMVTTYHLRPNAKWHDGAPLTAHDFVFSFEVYSNPQVPLYRRDPENYISSVEAADDHTVVINWKQPYYAANTLHYLQMDPLPSHILEAPYKADVASWV